MSNLFEQKLKVVNIGLESFQDALAQTGVESLQMDWKPSLPVDLESQKTIQSHKEKIEIANEKAIHCIQNAKPVLIGMGKALDVLPNMKKNMFLHAGPPITWERMCGPMKGAMMGAMIYEGYAQDAKEAEQKLASGEIEFSPCHEHSAVGPMAGVISPSMPVFIVKNTDKGNLSFSTQNEGLGKVLRYGAYSEDVIVRLKWMEEILYPTLKAAIESLKEIDLKSIIAQALHMGDEVHNRNRAGTSLLYRIIAPAVIATCENKDHMVKVLNFINGNDHFFLNLSMAACKCTMDSAMNIEGSSIVTVMARNGTDFGIKLAGTGSQWFVGPADLPDALFFPGFTKADANPDIGDSAITETGALGGMAMASAFAIVQFVGGTAADALRYTNEMYEITAAENNVYQIPSLDFKGTPTGIDVRLVIEKNILPFINTGVAHKDPGVGQVGAGVLSAPALPFQKAFNELGKKLK